MKIRIHTHLTAAILIAGSVSLHAADPVARAGDVEITVDDLQPRIEALSDQEKQALAANPALLNQFVRSLVVQQLVLQTATKEEFADTPKIAAELAQLRERAITQAYLEAKAEPAKDYPSDAEVEAAYNENQSALKVPDQVRLAQIFVALPRDADQEATAVAKVKIDEIQTSLGKSGSDFSAIAKARSEEPQSAAKGGEIGWLTEAQIQPGIRDEIGQLDAGKVSPAIQLEDGFHIVKVLETKPAYTPDLAEVRDALVQRMRQAKAEQNSQEYVAQLLQVNPVAINEMKLGELLPKN